VKWSKRTFEVSVRRVAAVRPIVAVAAIVRKEKPKSLEALR